MFSSLNKGEVVFQWKHMNITFYQRNSSAFPAMKLKKHVWNRTVIRRTRTFAAMTRENISSIKGLLISCGDNASNKANAEATATVQYVPAVNISALLAGDMRRLRCNRWPLPPNEQLALWATLSAYLLLLSLFIHAPVHVVSHVSHILHIVVPTPF